MMKIALDATPLTVASGGVRRYTEDLSRALAANFPDDEFWLLSDQQFTLPSHAPENLKIGAGHGNVLERRWWLWGLHREMARHGASIFHGTDFSVPYLPIRPSVLTLHDLSPWMNAAWHSDAGRVRRRMPVLLQFGLATMIITPSEAVRGQTIDRFHWPADRIVSIPLAAGENFHRVTAEPPSRPYLLYVGTLEPRKNLELLHQVWRELRKTHDIDLVLAGRRRDDFPEIAPEPGLRLLGLTPEEELPQLYSGALACLYPSYYEGFGLPVLEAMTCGTAVLASRDPAIMEVAGDGALLLDIREPRAWITALHTLLSQPERLNELRQKARRRAAEFSWTKTAKLTREVYDEAARRFRK